MEEALKRNNFKKMKETELRQTENNDMSDQPAGSAGEKSDEKTPKKDNWKSSQLESSWSKSIDDELKEAARLADKKQMGTKVTSLAMKIKKKKPKGMEELKKWFAEESPETSEVSENSESSDPEDVEETVERIKRNKMRKLRNRENKKKRKAETAMKASHTVGLKPISNRDIEAQREKAGDLNTARKDAVKKFLVDYLQFDKEDLETTEIIDTKVSPKGDNTVYVVFKEIKSIK